VSSPDELRSYAVDCARLAQSATDPHNKARLLTMARNWTDLASRIERLGQVADHVSNASAAEPAQKPRDH
jgi:hypothetical protein